uniref:Uncharacterized protein n=1 Tax=Avena sativa TaxID=4498 RepID=A0ACD5XNP2_AVESA
MCFNSILYFLCSNTFKGAKIEASVWGFDEVALFNRILQPGCKYTIHRVIISPNAESVEFRAIGHPYECHFNRITMVEPSLFIEFPILPKHLMPFSDVAKRPNKTFVDIVGIVVHCCDHDHFGRYGKYKEAVFMDVWGNLIPVGIWGLQLTRNSYLWSTAEGGNPIVIATMLEKDIKFGDLNTSDHTNVAFNPAHTAARPLHDIRQKIISGAIDMTFVQSFVERRWAFVSMVLAKRDARYRK